MRIIAVDDEKIALAGIMQAIAEAAPNAEINGFRHPEEALEYAKSQPVDVAFLDIEMRSMSGMELAGKLAEIKKDTNIIFTTGYSEYAAEAFGIRASGYVLKPVTAEKIKTELGDLKYPVAEDRRLTVMTFGNFEVFFCGAPLTFKYNKTKELFAYLIDRQGAFCSKDELSSVLWENNAAGKASYFANLRYDLLTTLEGLGLGDVVIKRRGAVAVDASKISCDYYDWLRGVNRENYKGEYMSQYSWAEATHGWIESGNADSANAGE